MKVRPGTYVKSVEVWEVGPIGRKQQVNKIAVRVRKGGTPGSNRPGTFGGATNFRSLHTSPQ